MVQLRHYKLPLAVVAASATATVVVAVVPAIEFAYREPGLHVAIETAAALVALLASFLVFGRFRRSGSVADLLLVCALAVHAASNLLFAAVPAALYGESRFATWSALIGRLLGSVLLAAAAFAPALPLRRLGRAAAAALGGSGLALAGAALALAIAADSLPSGVEARMLGDGARPNLDSHPALVVVQLVGMAAFALAAIGFVRRAAQRSDELLRWLAVATVLAAFASLNYVLYPSRYSDWVYTGDAFLLLFYGALLVGAALEIRVYWAGVAEAAVLEERRRIARDLHDGTAQELAFIVRRLRRLADPADDPLAPVVSAAERALDESRRAIEALTRPIDVPLDVALERAVEQIAARTGAQLALELAEDVHVDAKVREGLIRIACEAVANAARHSGAETIRVELSSEDHVHLRISDDGVGFDPESPRRPGGFGLTSMRERAEALGARLEVRAERGRGTRIDVEIA